MVAVTGLTEVQRAQDKLLTQARRDGKVVVAVGYTAAYALYVHEDLEAKHSEGQQAKFLEQPARNHEKDIGNTVAKVTKSTGSLEQGLLAGGMLLQRLSQQIVPVDTGNLKGSAFTEKE